MKKLILLAVLILLISSAYSFAEVPCKINYQGRLIENNVPVDGTRTMKFSIYNSAAGGNELWTSGNVNITVYNGLFRYVLDLSSIDDWTAGEALYLEVKVEDDILTPREELYAYPYAINSHLLEGETKDYFINISGDAQTKQGNLKIEGILDINAPDTDIDALRVHSGDTYGLYVSTGGNVGIGTTSPRGDLDIAGIDPTLRLTNLGVGNWDFVIEPRGEILNLSSAAETQIMAFKQNGNVGIGTTEPDATLDVDGTVSIFGSWTTKDSQGNTLVKDAVYEARTDGFVCASIFLTNNNAFINAYTGSSNPPPSVLYQGLPLGYSRYAAVTLPVKKDDYWKILVLEGTPTIRWLPVGSGTCVRQ